MAILATAATILSGVRSLVNEKDESFWLDTEINAWVLEALEDVATETHCLRTYKTYTILADDIFDEHELRMDEDFIAIDEGLVFYNDVACYPTTLARLVAANNEWKEETGTPSKYYVRGDMLGFDTQITAGDTVKFYQIERAAEIADAVAPFNGDYRLVNFRKLARDYAISMCWYKKSEDGKGDKWFARYQFGLDKMKELLGIDDDNSSMMIPAESLSHAYVKKNWPDWL